MLPALERDPTKNTRLVPSVPSRPPFVYAGAMDAQAIVLLNSEDALSQLKNK